MSADEAQELRENAEKAREDRSLAAVSLTMAVLAVLVAVVSLLGHRAHTEEVVLQALSSDQWSYYQAKNIREHEDDLFVASNNSGASPQVREKYAQEAERYKKEKDEIQEKARELEREVGIERARADRYDRTGDQIPFQKNGFAAVRLTSASEHSLAQHTPDDTPDGVSPSFTANVARVNGAAIVGLAAVAALR